MFKKHMTPLSKGGETKVHQGKGAQSTTLPNRGALNALASAPNAGLNDFSKATPMAQPAPVSPMPPGGPFGGGM